VVYASAKEGRASLATARRHDLRPLLDAILEHAPAPKSTSTAPLQFQAMTLDYDDFVGRLVIGRVARGRLRRGNHGRPHPGEGAPQSFRVTKLFGAFGLERRELEEAAAGDLVVIAGVDSIDIGDTVCDPTAARGAAARRRRPADGARALLGQQRAVRGPRGQVRDLAPDRRAAAARGARQRLDPDRGDREPGRLRGRRPRRDADRRADRDDAARGLRVLRLAAPRSSCARSTASAASRSRTSSRGARGLRGRGDGEARRSGAAGSSAMEQRGGTSVLQFVVPSRGLFGYRSEFLSDTRGEGILHRTVRGYEPWSGDLPTRAVGAIVATEPGETTRLRAVEDPGARRPVRAAGRPDLRGPDRRAEPPRRRHERPRRPVQEAHQRARRREGRGDRPHAPARPLTIETALGWIEEDELLEVTPVSLRLRKKVLSGSFRKR
jgi:GTP-binding protein